MKLNTYTRDSVANDFHNYALPSLPTEHGRIYSPCEVYEYAKPSIDENITDSEKLIAFELKYVQATMERSTLVGNLTRCFMNLVPLIKNADSPVSVSEPMFHIVFSFVYFYYNSIIRVSFILMLLLN